MKKTKAYGERYLEPEAVATASRNAAAAPCHRLPFSSCSFLSSLFLPIFFLSSSLLDPSVSGEEIGQQMPLLVPPLFS